MCMHEDVEAWGYEGAWDVGKCVCADEGAHA